MKNDHEPHCSLPIFDIKGIEFSIVCPSDCVCTAEKREAKRELSRAIREYMDAVRARAPS